MLCVFALCGNRHLDFFQDIRIMDSAELIDSEIFGFQRELSFELCWFETKEKAKRAIQSFEFATGTKFINLSHDIYDRSKSRIWWRVNAGGEEKCGLFDGVPHIILETTKMECQHGKDRESNRKEKRKRLSLAKENTTGVPKRKYIQIKGSKKKNCEAFIVMREIIRFPQFSINADAKSKRERASKKLREALRSQNTLMQEYRCYVQFPPRSSHSGHEPNQVKGFVLTDVNAPNSEELMTVEDDPDVQPPPPSPQQVIQIITDSLPYIADSDADEQHEVVDANDAGVESTVSTVPPEKLLEIDGLMDDIRFALYASNSIDAVSRCREDLRRTFDNLVGARSRTSNAAKPPVKKKRVGK